MTPAVDLSQKLLIAVKEDGASTRWKDELKKISLGQLAEDLKEENARKTFWINLYNAFVQILINEQSPNLGSRNSRIGFFRKRSIVIAGHSLSLNDIEHGMLRHSSVWWSLGYLKKLVVNNFEGKFRLSLDYRIHFALNCGATSCPAIRFYEPEKIDEQLEAAMEVFLAEQVKFDTPTNTVFLNKIFKWYQGDFGGMQDIVKLLVKFQVVPAGIKVKIKFSPYDWNIYRGDLPVKKKVHG